MAISAKYGSDANIFGQADYDEARKNNYSDKDIRDWARTTGTAFGPDMKAKFDAQANLDTQGVGTTGEENFDINQFDQLLNRLEASKGRQQRQKSVEGRRDIFQQGLAGMMSNF